MTYEEVMAAIEARLGTRVEVRMKDEGRVTRTCQGVLAPGAEGVARGGTNGEGKVFKVAPYAFWFQLLPTSVTGAQEEGDGRLLRVDLDPMELDVRRHR